MKHSALAGVATGLGLLGLFFLMDYAPAITFRQPEKCGRVILARIAGSPPGATFIPTPRGCRDAAFPAAYGFTTAQDGLRMYRGEQLVAVFPRETPR